MIAAVISYLLQQLDQSQGLSTEVMTYSQGRLNQGFDRSQQYEAHPFFSLLEMLTQKNYILLISYYLLLIGCQGCYSAPYKVSNVCVLCFNADNSFKSCTLTNYQSISQNTCRSVCCSLNYGVKLPNTCVSSSSYSQTQQQGGGLSTATILVIVFFSIPVVICIIAMIHSCVTNRNRATAVARVRDEPALSVANLADYNMDESFPYQIDIKQSCSICLQESCNIVTLCGHPYHSHCLAAWIKKRQKCPLCVSREYNPITLYCSQCSRAIKMSLLYKRMSQQEWQEWTNSSNSARCETCQKGEQKNELQITMNQEQIEKYLSYIKPPLDTLKIQSFESAANLKSLQMSGVKEKLSKNSPT